MKMNSLEIGDEISTAEELASIAYKIYTKADGEISPIMSALLEIENELAILTQYVQEINAEVKMGQVLTVLDPIESRINPTFKDLCLKQINPDTLSSWKSSARKILTMDLNNLNALIMGQYPMTDSVIDAVINVVKSETSYSDQYGFAILMCRYLRTLQLKGFIIVANYAYLEHINNPTNPTVAMTLAPFMNYPASQYNYSNAQLSHSELTQWVFNRNPSQSYGTFSASDGGDSYWATNPIVPTQRGQFLREFAFIQAGNAFAVNIKFDNHPNSQWFPSTGKNAELIPNSNSCYLSGELKCDPNHVIVGIQPIFRNTSTATAIGISIQQAPYTVNAHNEIIVGTPYDNWIEPDDTLGSEIFTNGPVHCNTYLSFESLQSSESFPLITGVKLGQTSSLNTFGGQIIPYFLPLDRAIKFQP